MRVSQVVLCLLPPGVFIARGKEDALVTLNMVPGETVYREKKVSVDVVSHWEPSLFIAHHCTVGGGGICSPWGCV